MLIQAELFRTELLQTDNRKAIYWFNPSYTTIFHFDDYEASLGAVGLGRFQCSKTSRS